MSKLGKSADAVGGVPIMSVMWFMSRAYLPAGFIPLDGQLLTRAVYPSAWDEINNGRVPVVTEAAWATSTNRGSFTVGDGSTTFRLPDLNGKSSGSLGAMFLRGDGDYSAGTDGLIQIDAMQGHSHSLSQNVAMKSGSGTATTGASTTVGSGAVTPDVTGITSDGTNGTPRTAVETRPRNVTGCFAIKMFGVITTADMQSTSAVSAQVASMYALGGRVQASTVKTLAAGGITFSGSDVPSWAREFELLFIDTQVPDAGVLMVRIGTGGTPSNTGYVSSVQSVGGGNATGGAATTAGFGIWGANNATYGSMQIKRFGATNIYIATHMIGSNGTNATQTGGGAKGITGTCDVIQIIHATAANSIIGSVQLIARA